MNSSSSTKSISHDEAVKKLGELIKDIKFAMLTTVEADGSLRSRPMTTQQDSFDGTLWFFTAASSGKSDDLKNDQHVNVAYASPEKNNYVSVSGKASVVRDSQKAKELWNPVFKAWFPGGLDDPELALLKVDVEHAEYWDSPSGPVAYIMAFARAIVSGGKGYSEGDDPNHQKVDLS